MSPDDLSNINLLGLAFTLAMGMALFVIPRRLAPIPIILVSCYITLGQVVNIGGLHFTMMRIIVLFGWIRVLVRGEISGFKWNGIDKALLWWVASSAVLYILREGSSEALINRLGFAYNAIGMYFLFRVLMQEPEDVLRTVKALALVVIPLALAMLNEKATGRNLFWIFGGVLEFTPERDGRLRCGGSFGHPILAGTFGAAAVPLFIGYWKAGGKFLSAIGVIAATCVAVASSSSGPLAAYLFGILAFFLWPLRRQMRMLRWGILIALISLHLIMKAPIWFLIGRLSALSGGTGFHRSALIDAAIRNFGEWWLVGTNYTRHWMPYHMADNPNMVDITNQFILEGVNGGVLSVILFSVMIIFCFRNLGLALAHAEDQASESAGRFMIWALGVSLCVHLLSFISVSYFDQMVVFWYLLLAMISAVAKSALRIEVPVPRNGLRWQRNLWVPAPTKGPAGRQIHRPGTRIDRYSKAPGHG